MRNRVLALAACELLLAGGGLWIVARHGGANRLGLPLLVGYTLAMVALVLLPRMFVEFRRHSFLLTPGDIVTLIGLFAVGPLYFVAIGTLAETIAAIKHRQTPLKTTFNLVHMFGGLVAAAVTFAALGRTDPADEVAWLAGVAAIAACVLWDLLSTATVLSFAESQPLRSMIAQCIPAAAVGLIVSATLGIAALVLFEQTRVGPLLFIPVLLIVFASTRGVAQQRAERQHIERLYTASSNLTQLVGLADMLATIAAEARTLVTGASALCSILRPDGSRVGILVDDHGHHDAPANLLAALPTIIGNGRSGEISVSGMERRDRQHLPPFLSMVWATKSTEKAGKVVLTVFRELPKDEQEGHRPDVLTAFVAHAAAVLDNVKLHEEVQQSLERQVALNRQKGEFVAAVSHELRTPLAAMMGSVQTVQRLAEKLPRDERDRLLDMGLSQGVRLKNLIEDLLLIAAADHEDIRVARHRVALGEFLQSIQDELTPLLDDRLTVAIHGPAVVALTDEEKLRRILVNLIDNARKYAPEGPITVTAELIGDTVTITVDDCGPGISEQDRERVFERFVQLDQTATRRQGGTGLGLALCRELAGRLDGSLTLKEAASGGARFVLEIPAALDTAGAHLWPASGAALPAGIVSSPLRRPANASPRPGGDRPAGTVRSRPTSMTRPAAESADEAGCPRMPRHLPKETLGE